MTKVTDLFIAHIGTQCIGTHVALEFIFACYGVLLRSSISSNLSSPTSLRTNHSERKTALVNYNQRLQSQNSGVPCVPCVPCVLYTCLRCWSAVAALLQLNSNHGQSRYLGASRYQKHCPTAWVAHMCLWKTSSGTQALTYVLSCSIVATSSHTALRRGVLLHAARAIITFSDYIYIYRYYIYIYIYTAYTCISDSQYALVFTTDILFPALNSVNDGGIAWCTTSSTLTPLPPPPFPHASKGAASFWFWGARPVVKKKTLCILINLKTCRCWYRATTTVIMLTGVHVPQYDDVIAFERQQALSTLTWATTPLFILAKKLLSCGCKYS